MELVVSSNPKILLRNLEAKDREELVRIRKKPEVFLWWGEHEEDYPLDKEEGTRLIIEVEEKVGGLIQFYEEEESKYRHASIDIFLDPIFQGQGLATKAIQVLTRYLLEERGHHRIVIDPALNNKQAIRAYEKAGFKPIGVMRKYEKDSEGEGWHDGYLMELVV